MSFISFEKDIKSIIARITKSEGASDWQNGAIHPSDVPAAANSTGTAGTITWESGFLYVCVATDTWLRIAIATW